MCACAQPVASHGDRPAPCCSRQPTDLLHLQGVGVPPHPLDEHQINVRMMLLQLLNWGVPPQALQLPRRPDPGRCRLCQLGSLEALVTVLLDVCDKALSQHKQVMRHRQLWSLVLLSPARPLEACALR